MVRGPARGCCRCARSRASVVCACFRKLGDTDEAADVHRAAGLRDVEATVLRERRTAPSAACYWDHLARENGHFRRVQAESTETERNAIVCELELRFAPFEEDGHLSLPRALVLVTARR